MPTLWLAQREFGWLSLPVHGVRRRADGAAARVGDVGRRRSTRCTGRSRSGRWHLQLCRNLPCALRGAREIQHARREPARHPRRRDDGRRPLLARGGRVPRLVRHGAGAAAEQRRRTTRTSTSSSTLALLERLARRVGRRVSSSRSPPRRRSFVLLLVLQVVGLGVFFERKVSAADPGPHRREPRVDLRLRRARAHQHAGRRPGQVPPEGGRRARRAPTGVLHFLAPCLAVVPVAGRRSPSSRSATCSSIGGRVIELQAAELDVGVLYVLAMASLGVYGVVLGGWASNNRWSLLGGIRGSAQMISYEIAMGLALVGVVLTYGTLDLQAMVARAGRAHRRLAAGVGHPLPAARLPRSSWSPASPSRSASRSTCRRASPSW